MTKKDPRPAVRFAHYSGPIDLDDIEHAAFYAGYTPVQGPLKGRNTLGEQLVAVSRNYDLDTDRHYIGFAYATVDDVADVMARDLTQSFGGLPPLVPNDGIPKGTHYSIDAVGDIEAALPFFADHPKHVKDEVPGGYLFLLSESNQR